MAVALSLSLQNLTCALHNRLSEGGQEVRSLGVDLDPLLVQRAVEGNSCRQGEVAFLTLDLLGPRDQVLSTLTGFLEEQGRAQFDLVCVFSVTMWVHLHHGDEGLRQFLSILCGLARRVVLEPQPWKCYKTAERRAKRAGEEAFPALQGLKVRGPGVEEGVLGMCLEEGMEVEQELGTNNWSRRLLLLKRKEESDGS